MEIFHSTKINEFETYQVCTLVLRFVSYVEKENVHTFFVNCKSSDNLIVVCFGRTNLETNELSKLEPNNILLVKDVVTGQRRPRIDGVSHDFKIGPDSKICLLSSNLLSLRQIFPSQKPGILKLSSVIQSLKAVQFSDDQSDVDSLIETSANPLPNVDHSKNLLRFDVDDMCTVVLKIESYVINKKHNLIFINCNTSDNMPVTVATLLYRHTEEMKRNDIVQFVDVKRISLKNGVYGLRLYDDSHAFLYYSSGQTYDPPKELLNGEQLGNSKDQENSGSENLSEYDYYDSTNVNIASYQPNHNLFLEEFKSGSNPENGKETASPWPAIPENKTKSKNEIVAGKLTSNFEDDEHYETKFPIYTANFLLDNSRSEIKLLLDADFANWPLQFLRKGHRVSVGGENVEYLGRNARYVRKGDHFDSIDPLQASSSKQL